MTDDNVVHFVPSDNNDMGLRYGKGARPADNYERIAAIIDGKIPFFKFPHEYKIIKPGGGARAPILVKDGVAQIATLGDVAEDILLLSSTNNGRLTWKNAVEAADLWLHRGAVDPEPKAVGWADDPGLVYSRMPWTYDPGPAPLFDEMFGRMTNASAVIEWIGSLFDENADRQQYVWIFGGGQNGKSALAAFLKRVFGCAYAGTKAPGKDNKHWTASLLGKRLVCFPDCNNYGFPASGDFKILSGGDQVEINPKNRDIFSADLIAKFLFLSNERPALSSEKADMRRAIYAEMMEITGAVDPHYQDKLWEQGGHFLSRCVENYRTHYPNGGPITVDHIGLASLIAEEEEPFSVLFDHYFSISPTLKLSSKDLQYVLTKELKDPHQRREFRNWMKRRKYLGDPQTVRINDIPTWGYLGIGKSKVWHQVEPPRM